MKGLTGTIKFDQHGLRTDFSLEVVELKKEGLAKVRCLFLSLTFYIIFHLFINLYLCFQFACPSLKVNEMGLKLEIGHGYQECQIFWYF